MEQFSTPGASSPSVQKKKSSFIELLQFAIVAIIIVVPIRLFVAQPFVVSGASMQPTFENGEYLIVDQLTYRFESPARGDVIVFQYPHDPSKYFIKRIIGLPGETVVINDNVVSVVNDAHPDGMVLDEPYVEAMSRGGSYTQELGDGEYFVMGDNRDQSSDSRVWGVLEYDRIVGRAFLRLLPLSDASFLPGIYRAAP